MINSSVLEEIGKMNRIKESLFVRYKFIVPLFFAVMVVLIGVGCSSGDTKGQGALDSPPTTFIGDKEPQEASDVPPPVVDSTASDIVPSGDNLDEDKDDPPTTFDGTGETPTNSASGDGDLAGGEKPADEPTQSAVLADTPSWVRVVGNGRVDAVLEATKGNEENYEFRAIPDEGWYFVHWDTLTTFNNPYNYQADDVTDPDLELTAVFHQLSAVRVPDTTLTLYEPDIAQLSPSIATYRDIYNSALNINNLALIDAVIANPEIVKSIYSPHRLNEIVNGSNFTLDDRIFLRSSFDLPTLVHESAHVYDHRNLTAEQRARVNQLYSIEVATFSSDNGCNPMGDPTVGSNCGPYQLRTVSEFFAVMSTAFSGIPDGDIGRGSTPPREDLQMRYPAVYDLLVEVYR